MIPEIGFAARRVLASRTRRRALLALGPAGAAGFARFLAVIVPQAKAALREIESRAGGIADPALRRQALSSVRSKAYHVAGGCIYAAFLPPAQARTFVSIVAPLESLYDYLDTLCDRHDGVPADAYPVLHEALADALDPARDLHDYFRLGPQPDDGGYLRELVVRTRAALCRVPGYERLRAYLQEAAAFYTGLQTYKHADAARRVPALQSWHTANGARFGDLSWWEFAAAAGSQFHVYAMLYAALAGAADPARVYDAYFPAMSALHVLFDDFIDQAEDAAHGELNFARRYASEAQREERFGALYDRSWTALRAADPHSAAHTATLRVMTLFYLTHPKIFQQGLDTQAKRLLTRFAAAG